MKKKLLAMLCAFGCIMAFAGCNTRGGTSDSSTPDGSTPDSTPVCNHTYDNACDADCNECGEERTPAEHVYDNACDADCNECGEERTPSDHVYDNAGDKDCNECGDIRELSKFTVTFNVDGGEAVDSIQVEYGTAATELANVTTTKAGYVFAGWTLENGEAIPEGSILAQNITVKAKWDIVTYTAKIVRSDGNEESVEFTIENRAQKLAEIALTANDAQYTYSWVIALPTELALNNEQVFTETRTVNNYTVTFDVDGGSAVELQTVPYGTSASALASFSSTKVGYTFAGWTLEDGSAIPASATVTGDLTVKASWTPSTDTAYNVGIYLETLDGYLGTATQTIAGTGTTGETVEIDYNWMTAQGLSIPTGYSLDHENSVFSGVIVADGSLVLKVCLKMNVYTVTVNGETSTAKHGATLSLPANPVQDGYIFKEWQIGGTKVDETYVITTDTTVEAAWYVDLTAESLFEIDLSSSSDYVVGTSSIGKVTGISLNGNALDISESTDTTLTVANATIVDSGLKGGVYSNLVLTTESAEYMVKFTAVTKYLNAENVTSYAALKAILEADMNGYYVLSGNINLAAAGSNSQRATRAIGFGAVSGTTHANYTEFNGTIDGRGYAIQNLEYNWRADGGNHDHALIDVIGANGVIKNLALTNVRAVVSGARIAGLVWTNKGAIENCYVDYTNTAGVGGQNAEWGQAAMVLINDGTVKDCITKLTATEKSLGSNCLAIVTKNGGTVSNVNAIVSVTADVDPVVVFIDNGTTMNSAYTTSIDAFYTANVDAQYTSSYWTFDEDTYTTKFGEVVIAESAAYEMTTAVVVDKSISQVLSLDISDLSGSIREVKINNLAVVYELNEGVLSIAYEQLSSYTGDYTLSINMGAAVYNYPLIVATKCLNSENVTSWATLKSTLEADMNAYYVLTSNINLAAAGSNSQRVTRAIGYSGTEFNGTLNGNGYAIQNMEYNWRADGGNHDHSLFQTIGSNGTVKNLALTGIIVKTASARASSLAINNKGIVENCFVEYNATAGVSGSNSQWGQAALVLKNDGTMTDCLVKLTISTDLSANYICLVTDNNGTIDNVIGIVSTVGDGDAATTNSGSGVKTNCGNFANAAAFYTNNCDANYTSSYWSFDESNATISFGGNVVVS